MKDKKKTDDHSGHSHDSKVTVDAHKTPIYYTNSVFIGSDNYGVTLDFAQRVGPTADQNIVARVGMSAEHAKSLLKVLNENIEKYER